MQKENKKSKNFLKTYWIEIALLIITPIVVSSYGIAEFPILKDLGFFYYIGQELLRGYSIYSTVYINHSPLAAVFYAFGLSVFSFLPQYLSIRTFMLIIISFLVLMFYRILLKIFNDKLISVLSVLILLSFTFFVELSLLGDTKVLALFFSFLSLILLFDRHYLVSGFFSTAAFFFWQPFGAFLIAPFIFVFLNQTDPRIRIKKIGRTLLGSLILLISLVAYFSLFGSLIDFINFNLLYPIKYESSSVDTWNLWTLLNVLGYYSSEIVFLFLGIVVSIYVLYKALSKTMKRHSLDVFFKNKYLISFALPFLVVSLALIKDFDNGSDIVPIIPAISILAAYGIKKIQVRLTKIIPNRIATVVLILLVCSYGFFPALQPVYPENPIIRDRYKFIGKTSPFEMILSVQNEYGLLKSLSLFFFRRAGEQVTIKHQLELAKIIQDNTNEDEKILCLSSPEILFLSKRRSMNPYPLFVMDNYKIARDRGDIFKIKEDVLEYRPKFILANNELFIEKLGLTEFIEKNYEKMPFEYYGAYRYAPSS